MKKKYKLLKDWNEHKADEVIELEEAIGKTLCETGYAEEVAGDDTIDDELQSAVGELQTQVKTIISDAVKASIGDLSVEMDSEGKLSAITGIHDRELDDMQCGFNNLNEFMKEVRYAEVKGSELDERLKIIRSTEEKAATGQNELDGSDGAWLVPPEFSNRLLERIVNDSTGVIEACDKITMARNSIVINGLADHDRSGTTNRYGGVVVYWVAEAGQITSSSLKFRQVELRLNKLAALVYCTDEELEDANISLAKRINDKVGDAIADETIEAIMFGNGVKKPLGAFVSPCIESLAKESGQAADTIVFENIIKMQAKLWAKSTGNAKWFFNQECIPQLRSMYMSVGTGGVPVYLPGGSIAGAPFTTIDGRPGISTEHCAALGDTGDVILGDFSQYILAMKGTVKTAMSIHLRFDYDETAYKFTFRVDGKPAWDQALTPRKGASGAKVSPFVTLAERA